MDILYRLLTTCSAKIILLLQLILGSILLLRDTFLTTKYPKY